MRFYISKSTGFLGFYNGNAFHRANCSGWPGALLCRLGFDGKSPRPGPFGVANKEGSSRCRMKVPKKSF